MGLTTDALLKLVQEEDQVEDQDLGGRDKESCGHCGGGPSVISIRLTSIEDELVIIHKLPETKSRRRSKCVSSSIRSSRKRLRKALQFSNSKKTKVNAFDGPYNLLLDQVVDASYKTISLTDPTHVHNDDGPSSPLLDQVDDASFKPLHGEVVDSGVDSEDRSPNGRITDVLAHIHGEDDIEKF
ncbi:hypothetical protein K7X08_023347 [Anisodus acutangulus]|uniref:Uncharacterized protein n=1 Tax=Anisodus acutangulus TaxID=402998 RepID=A0A9Q1LEN8_9SOLA|nr:hypothetical protein K7X08_023347 [Anisodus acutangulus]